MWFFAPIDIFKNFCAWRVLTLEFISCTVWDCDALMRRIMRDPTWLSYFTLTLNDGPIRAVEEYFFRLNLRVTSLGTLGQFLWVV